MIENLPEALETLRAFAPLLQELGLAGLLIVLMIGPAVMTVTAVLTLEFFSRRHIRREDEARRLEFNRREKDMRSRYDALERRIDAGEIMAGKFEGKMEKIEDRLKSIDEKLHWRLAALDNQVTILLRGHLEWEEK